MISFMRGCLRRCCTRSYVPESEYHLDSPEPCYMHAKCSDQLAQNNEPHVHTRPMHLPVDCEAFTLRCIAGGAGIPLHWSLQADTRNVCLRFAPDSPGEAGPQWSHPLELEKSLSSTARYISLPVRPAAASSGSQAVRGHPPLAKPVVLPSFPEHLSVASPAQNTLGEAFAPHPRRRMIRPWGRLAEV